MTVIPTVQDLLKDLQHYQTKRLFPKWQPKRPTVDLEMPKDEKYHVVLRCLAFLPLELQVAEWDDMVSGDLNTHFDVINPTERQTWDEIAKIIERNGTDEEKHDRVLKYLAEYMGKDHQSDTANALINRWQTLDRNPITLTYALESGVFFSILPTLSKFGDVYASLVSQWINDDEKVHVETGLRLMKYFNLKVDNEIVRLVYDTNKYIYLPLGEEEAIRRAKRAVRRLVTTKDAEMARESVPVTIANFEQKDRRSIAY